MRLRCRPLDKGDVDAVRFVHILLIRLVSFAYCVDMQAQDSTLVDPNEIEAFAEDFFPTQMESMHVPGAIFVVVEGGQIAFSKGYGYSNLQSKTPVTPEQTLFRVGSVSKLFTATAVMQLYEQGRIDLQKDVNTQEKYMGQVMGNACDASGVWIPAFAGMTRGEG